MKTFPVIQAYGELSTSHLGSIGILATNSGIARVVLSDTQKQGINIPPALENLNAYLIINQALTELDQYLSGKKRSHFKTPIDWSFVSDFQKKVLKLAQAIPYGEVSTYGDLALQLGSPHYSRAVGSALTRNPYLLFVPCHRVIGKDGLTHGFSAPGGIQTKQKLLRLEGVNLD